jgi:polyisoprenoid-binding protein YceI
MKLKTNAFLSIFIYLVSLNLFSETTIQKFHYKDFETAQKAETSLRFESISTKLGMISSHFEGQAKIFSISYNIQNNKLEDVKIKINTASFDTDSKARNEKMNELCLESSKFPEITGTISSPINIGVQNQELPVEFMVKGHLRKLTMKVSTEKKLEKVYIKISGNFSLKEWEIPDPSIVIAKVRDQFDLYFETIINETK